eukprot:Gb_33935 [translate_table: standard]
MGNALECCVSGIWRSCGNDEVRREIKVMKLDGHILRFNGSICVKEVLLDYPNHAVVPYDKGCCPTVGGPLSPHTKLEGGHLYFPIPLHLIPYHISIAAARLQQLRDDRRRCCSRDSCDRALQIVPCDPPPAGAVPRTRVKIRMTKKQLQDVLLSRELDIVDLLNSFLRTDDGDLY